MCWQKMSILLIAHCKVNQFRFERFGNELVCARNFNEISQLSWNDVLCAEEMEINLQKKKKDG